LNKAQAVGFTVCPLRVFTHIAGVKYLRRLSMRKAEQTNFALPFSFKFVAAVLFRAVRNDQIRSRHSDRGDIAAEKS